MGTFKNDVRDNRFHSVILIKISWVNKLAVKRHKCRVSEKETSSFLLPISFCWLFYDRTYSEGKNQSHPVIQTEYTSYLNPQISILISGLDFLTKGPLTPSSTGSILPYSSSTSFVDGSGRTFSCDKVAKLMTTSLSPPSTRPFRSTPPVGNRTITVRVNPVVLSL